MYVGLNVKCVCPVLTKMRSFQQISVTISNVKFKDNPFMRVTLIRAHRNDQAHY